MLHPRRGLAGLYTLNRPPWGRLVWVRLEPPRWRVYSVLAPRLNGPLRVLPLFELHALGGGTCLGPPGAQHYPGHAALVSYDAHAVAPLVLTCCEGCHGWDMEKELVVSGRAEAALPELLLPPGGLLGCVAACVRGGAPGCVAAGLSAARVHARFGTLAVTCSPVA